MIKTGQRTLDIATYNPKSGALTTRPTLASVNNMRTNVYEEFQNFVVLEVFSLCKFIGTGFNFKAMISFFPK